MVSKWVGEEGVGWTGQTELRVGAASPIAQTLSSMLLTVDQRVGICYDPKQYSY